MQNSKTVAQTLLGETAHLGFCPPKIGFFRGVGGGGVSIFFLIGILFYWLVRSPCKNLKSYDKSFLEIEQTRGGGERREEEREIMPS